MKKMSRKIKININFFTKSKSIKPYQIGRNSAIKSTEIKLKAINLSSASIVDSAQLNLPKRLKLNYSNQSP